MATPAVGPPGSIQLDLRSMGGEVLSWNPDLGYEEAYRIVNNWYRKTLRLRNWFSLSSFGQIVTPNVYSTGSVALTSGNTLVYGTGTAWTTTMVGLQFQAGFQQPIVNIVAVDPVGQVITLSLPWGGGTIAAAGYSIFQNLVSLGPRVNYVLSMVNQQMGYSLDLHVPLLWVNAIDVWRVTVGWTTKLIDREPDSNGNPQWELWPRPTSAQTYPYWGYYQPPDLVNDGDYPINMVNSDILVAGAISHALVFRGKSSKYYDPQTAKRFRDEWAQGCNLMIAADNQLVQRDMKWDYGGSFTHLGGIFNQAHAVNNEGLGDWP